MKDDEAMVETEGPGCAICVCVFLLCATFTVCWIVYWFLHLPGGVRP